MTIFFVVFIAILVLIIFGWATILKKVFPMVKETWVKNETDSKQVQSNTFAYECDNCGAGIEDGDDVSPNGDVKCKHCKKWFNIHNQN